MYHHVNSNTCSNDLSIFEKHLEYISNNYISVFPSDKLFTNSICLVFDDAYADFYYYIFPLLKKYNLKALLAVPTKYIIETTNLSKEQRLNYIHDDLLINYQSATCCTFEELEEMVKSGLVQICSHSHSHINLLEKGVDFKKELLLSKEILEKRLDIEVESFVFPFGKYNQEILEKTKEIYKYAFRIGNAVQKDFNGINGVIYRIKGDELKSEDEIFKPLRLLKYYIKGLFKKVTKR
ncbi:polysaccharide deacetylase [Campylobacter blaseri]|uniref:Polysaccharide deacetylase n=2 Tax=Campylobacter blaseri TaxID=2042961 RepID=A0A2P8R045_9BACT|nr:polysaccharide deacetylase [Campylobacter blaseri]PSM53649.1 polysaccharide deacetylase [Campylobacter blaseri]